MVRVWMARSRRICSSSNREVRPIGWIQWYRWRLARQVFPIAMPYFSMILLRPKRNTFPRYEKNAPAVVDFRATTGANAHAELRG